MGSWSNAHPFQASGGELQVCLSTLIGEDKLIDRMSAGEISASGPNAGKLSLLWCTTG